MAAFNLEKITLENDYYRVVISTNQYQQLVLMSLNVGGKIPNEIHQDTDQFIRIERGQATVIINQSDIYTLQDGDSITIPSGTYHEVINSGTQALKIYTIYSPPHHPADTLQIDQ